MVHCHDQLLLWCAHVYVAYRVMAVMPDLRRRDFQKAFAGRQS
jgi:hypothetical protein